MSTRFSLDIYKEIKKLESKLKQQTHTGEILFWKNLHFSLKCLRETDFKTTNVSKYASRVSTIKCVANL